MPVDKLDKPISLMYHDNLSAEIGRLRVLYEPRPTPWFGQNAEAQTVTTEQWIAIFAGAGIGIDEFHAAVEAWVLADGGERFPAPLDLMRLVARLKRGEPSRREVPADRVMCDGSGWRHHDDEPATPCGRCNPALAAVWADDSLFAAWKAGSSLADLDVGVEERRGMLRYIVPLRLDPPCSFDARDDVYPDAATGLTIARTAYANECDAQGRAPSWDHFDRLIANAVARHG